MGRQCVAERGKAYGETGLTLWVKAQHEGALTPPCIIRKDPLVPHTARPGAAAFSSYDGDLSLPLGLALGSPIFPSGCEGLGLRGNAGGGARVTAGPKRPHLSLCP